MIKYSEQKYATSTVEVNYVEGSDNGPPVVLIHGLGSRWTDWDPVIDQFAEKWHVYAVDLLGHGDSGRVHDGYGFVDYPTEVMEFLRDVVAQPAYLVGHSLGAITSLGLCVVAPDLVAAAALEDPPLHVDVAPQFQTVLDIRNKNLNVNDMAVELRKADAVSADSDIVRQAIAVTKADPGVWESAVEGRLPRGWDPEVVLAAANVPVLLQASPDMGGILTDTDANRAADLLPKGRYVKWDDVGHSMHDAQPEERFVQLVNAFFGQVFGSRGSRCASKRRPDELHSGLSLR